VSIISSRLLDKKKTSDFKKSSFILYPYVYTYYSFVTYQLAPRVITKDNTNYEIQLANYNYFSLTMYYGLLV